jgi:hypothetical protein
MPLGLSGTPITVPMFFFFFLIWWGGTKPPLGPFAGPLGTLSPSTAATHWPIVHSPDDT